MSAMRDLPSVERLAASLPGPHELAVRAAREAVDELRGQLRDPQRDCVATDAHEAAAAALVRLRRSSLIRVLNATGVVVHTNLGRAPLARDALDAVAEAGRGYSTLELDPEQGGRGSRQRHVSELLRDLTGAEDALVVNNCAAAVLLACACLAGNGKEVVISRGQLVEIGGSFRMPDVVAQSGARLAEVGTTNRTRLSDYEEALGPDTGAILRAHPSNFRTLGFTEEVEIEALCSLGTPVIDDVGSGVLSSGYELFAEEPPVRRSVAAGAALVCFSGDKLLGGPQAGILVGTAEAVALAGAHPLARAVRIDKLSLAALEATLRIYREPRRAREAIPVLAMLEQPPERLEARARALAGALTAAGVRASVLVSTGKVGGGALPLLELEGPAVEVTVGTTAAQEISRRLRLGDPPLVCRVRDAKLLLEVRTLSDEEAEEAAGLVVRALAPGR